MHQPIKETFGPKGLEIKSFTHEFPNLYHFTQPIILRKNVLMFKSNNNMLCLAKRNPLEIDKYVSEAIIATEMCNR